MIIGAYGSNGRGTAGERANAASAVLSDAKVLIHRRIELKRDGSIKSDDLQLPGLMQVNEQECDAELRQQETECVFLIYEIQ
ncbi:hypothetical protein NYA22BAC_02622 [Parasphingorhabdus sp. NYA22]